MYIVSQDRKRILKLHELILRGCELLHSAPGDPVLVPMARYETPERAAGEMREVIEALMYKDTMWALSLDAATPYRYRYPACEGATSESRRRDEVLELLEWEHRCPEGALGEAGQDPYEGLPKVAPRKSWYRGV